MALIEIDGSLGEGGGQILRTSLALSLVTGKAVELRNIRAGRKRPGLMKQHLAAVRAAAAVSDAEVSGAELGSQHISFSPAGVRGGSHHFDVGSAGSCTLVLQTVLPALMVADGPSEVLLRGGTHNPMAPPFDFVQKAFLPLIGAMGPEVQASLERHGFYPAGGGSACVSILPSKSLKPLDLRERGSLVGIGGRALLSNLPMHIGEREISVLKKRLDLPDGSFEIVPVREPRGPGNAVVLEVVSENITEVFTGFGFRGIRAEDLAGGAAEEAGEYLGAGVPVGRHLADQLLLPMALAGAGSFETLSPTAHTLTNIAVIKEFVNVSIHTKQVGEKVWEVSVERSSDG